MKPVSEAFLERKAQEWIAWAKIEHKNPEQNALRVWDFWDEQGIDYKCAYKWSKKHDTMKSAHQLVKRVIGSRREKGALTKKYDPNMVYRFMPLYDSSIKKLEEWRANLKKEANMGSGTIIVQIPEVPTSKMVPERKKNEE